MAVIPYEDVIDRQPLPIDAQNVVTRVRLVVAGNAAGAEPAELRVGEREEIGLWDSHGSFPLPIVWGYQSELDSVYRATRSFSLPSGVNPFLPPQDPGVPEPFDVAGVTNPGSPSAIRDGDPTTFAESTGGGQAFILYSAGLSAVARGFKLRYSLVTDVPLPERNRQVFVAHYGQDAGDSARVIASRAFTLRPTESLDEPVDLYAVTMPDARGEAINRGGEVLGKAFTAALSVSGVGEGSYQLRVYEFYPLTLNTELLTRIARAQVRHPARNPQRVTVRGYVAPDREHTIVGWPGGDLTATVAQHQYELGRTVIDFEQAGSPAGLPAEAIEAARERRAAIEDTVQLANYGLKMGSRA